MSQGNIGIHSRKERRYICHVCGQTFTASKGTVFYRLRTGKDIVVLVLTLRLIRRPVSRLVVKQ